jgi:hypothetical protein
MPNDPMDDVIRIRIDTTRAVEAFLALLAEQAAEGETRRPANPAATAIWRELAPFRLVEYGYVDEGVGAIQGAYLGFPDGALYDASDDVPEEAVTRMVAGNEESAVPLPPIYVYVLLAQPAGRDAIDRFLTELSSHVGHALLAVVKGPDGGLRPRLYDADAANAVAGEAARHFSRDGLLAGIASGSQRPDGRAYAVLTYAYARQVLEFSDAESRDDFVAWSKALCDWIFGHGDDAAELGFAEAHRPATVAPVPDDDRLAIRVMGPRRFDRSIAWDGLAEGAGPDAVDGARDYWSYVRGAIDAVRHVPDI